MLSKGGGDSTIDSTSLDVFNFNDFKDGLDVEPKTDI
jgi:hypothetical protein